MTIENFLQAVHAEISHQPLNKFGLLTNYISHTVHEIILDCPTYEEAMDILQVTYWKPKNEILSQLKLATRYQLNGESLKQYLKQP